jgi:nickel-dependent lactate racemase
MKYFSEGSAAAIITPEWLHDLIDSMVGQMGKLDRVLIVPPDFTRYPSGAGEITCRLYQNLAPKSSVTIMPALGTHRPMTEEEISEMFPGIPHDIFQQHRWRGPLAHLGEVPSEFIEAESEGQLHFSVNWDVNRLLLEVPWDRIISIGQLLPHEVSGISNHSKNILVGLGGPEAIHKTHYFSAVFGRERIMGRVESPLRNVFNHMSDHFLRGLPITYIMTVRDRDEAGRPATRGIYAGDGYECFLKAARLCQRLNITLLDEPLKKVVVYLDPREYQSAWLGNKAIYRTCMALADGAELVILAPGVVEFGEDPAIDSLIRTYGYRGKKALLEAAERNKDLQSNLGAAAALINGSSNGRFSITYCTNDLGGGKGLTKREIESVGYAFAPLTPMMKRYNPKAMRNGYNTMSDGQAVYFISDPGLGLWALKSQFQVATSL